MTKRFVAVLARLGMPTGDGRLLTPGGITNRDLPRPLLYQPSTGEAHSGASVVASLDAIEYGPDIVISSGHFIDGAPNVEEAIKLVEEGVIGPSVDLDDVEYVYDEATGMAVITKGRIAGATLVAIPAFADVYIRMASEDANAGVGLVASVRSEGWADMPIADEATAWDGDAARARVTAWSGVDAEDAGTGEWSKYARAFLIKDDDADPYTTGAYSYGIADVVDGTLTIIPSGVFAAAAALQGARGAQPGPDADQARSVLSGIYKRLDRTPPWAEEDMALTASAWLPPLEWFKNPSLDGPTPITITDDGRVFGHVATWGTCHVGLPGCVTPPNSPSEYSYFMVGAERTADGVVVPVGKLTVGGGHAEPGAGFRAAADHYDNVGTAVASVFAGEDDHGIWVSGYILPTATEAQRAELLRSPLSGDWRSIGGNLELIAAHAVNVPGFPIKRTQVKFAAGMQMSLVGNFGIIDKPTPAPEPEPEDSDAVKARVKWMATQIMQKGR